MAGRWEEVQCLTFKRSDLPEGALDLKALAELTQCQKLLEETAKAVWHEAHPGRERLAAHFEQTTRLFLRRIEGGSAVARLEAYIEEEEQHDLWEPKEIRVAAKIMSQAYRALEAGTRLPETLPKHLVAQYENLGETLTGEEELEIRTPGEPPARVTAALRERWKPFIEVTHEDTVDTTGEVLEADVRQRRFQLWLDEGSFVTVGFSQDQEAEVTSALRDHGSVRLQVKGRAAFSPEGRMLRVLVVDEMRLRPLGEPALDPRARPIWEELAELARKVPKEEWDKLPSDLSDNIDHYVYGVPKR
jgi:hypothetical protein